MRLVTAPATGLMAGSRPARADAVQRLAQAQRRNVVRGGAGVGQRGLQDGLGRAVEDAAGNAAHQLVDGIEQAALAAQRAGQRAHGAGGVAQHGGQRLGIVGVGMEQAAGAGHGLAQAIDQAAQAGAQPAGQARAGYRVAQAADRPADLRQHAVDRRAQSGGGADLLRQADGRVDHRLERRIQGLAHRAQRVVGAQRQQAVGRAAGVAQRGFQQARAYRVHRRGRIRIAGGAGAARAAGVARAARVGGSDGGGRALAAAVAAAAATGQRGHHDGRQQGNRETGRAVVGLGLGVHDPCSSGLEVQAPSLARCPIPSTNRASFFQDVAKSARSPSEIKNNFIVFIELRAFLAYSQVLSNRKIRTSGRLRMLFFREYRPDVTAGVTATLRNVPQCCPCFRARHRTASSWR
ncbi:hypothetical protein CC56_1101 [Bordetella pertussis H934]|nr:hypothetical protein CC56_1101 [Bordetella pertussis H934]